MTLHRKTFGDAGAAQFDVVPEEEEATIRATVVADGSTGPLLYNDSGFECVHSDDEAGAIRAQWEAAASAPAPVPAEVTNFQGRTALRMAGLFDPTVAAINAIADDTQRAIALDAFSRGSFARGSALIAQIASALGKTDAEIDDLFRTAATINV